ncbi:cytochrome P450 [Periconia macrospinosa]|uniref:Cytochrome P450 n=1 Tax=Periconia macrospinosa TaxID=97972 RepID=A0A2V1DIY2_9PLEO|nr:cytochrome P450 [Periconia macrospinosa]
MKILLIVGYRVFLHPLRNFPGPFAARFTSAYGTFFVWRRTFHIDSLRLHEKYAGPVVRIAPNRLIFNSATALQDMYNNPKVVKGSSYSTQRQSAKGTPNLFNTIDKEAHSKKRRIIGPVISERSMRVFEPDMLRQIDAFLLRLLRSSRIDKFVNTTPPCERLAVDIIGQLAFGYPLNTQNDPTHRVIVEGLKTRGRRSSLYFFWPDLKILEPLFNWIEGKNTLDGLYRSVRTMIQARMAIPKDAKHDFFALASGKLSTREPGLISKDLWAEAVFFIAAGGSTTSTALSGMFFYLSRNPDVYARLASEIRSTFSSRCDIRAGHELHNCKYLRAVIDETMRMSPSSLGPAWRSQDPASIAAGEVFTVDGHVIPPGTQVGSSRYAVQHNEAFFPEPFKFQPERWLSSEDDSPEDQEARAAMRRAFAPFSLGDRSCAGKAMAYLEMSLTIAKTMWYFGFKKTPGEAGNLGETLGRPDEFQLYYSLVVENDGPNLVFTPRGEHWRDLEPSDSTSL